MAKVFDLSAEYDFDDERAVNKWWSHAVKMTVADFEKRVREDLEQKPLSALRAYDVAVRLKEACFHIDNISCQRGTVDSLMDFEYGDGPRVLRGASKVLKQLGVEQKDIREIFRQVRMM